MNFLNLASSQNAAGEKTLDVMIYGVIEPGWFDDAGVKSAEVSAMLAEHADAVEVTNHINSLGGDVFGGIAIRNALMQHPAAKAGRMRSVIEGVAASVGSVIAMAGRTVMQRGAMMMIHSPWTVAAGSAADLRETADVLDKIGESLVAIYREKTGKSAAELRKMLASETWLTADEAKAEGFADEIEAKPVKARADGDSIFLNSIAFARAGLPAPILAMAAPVAAPIVPPSPQAEAPPAPAEPAPKQPPAASITRERIAVEAPDLIAEWRAEGAAAERARIKALDELVPDASPAARAVIRAAQFDTLCTVEAVAVDLLRAAAVKPVATGAPEMLAARARDSAPVAAVGGAPPPQPTEDEKRRERAAAIRDQINTLRGGNGR